ncbi:hypothetical protein V8C43DRAFT_283622 [Trichoderma afarasin]
MLPGHGSIRPGPPDAGSDYGAATHKREWIPIHVRTCTASDGVCLIGMPGKSSHMLRPCMWPAVRAKCLARLVSPGALFPGFVLPGQYWTLTQAGIRGISSLVAADLPLHRGINPTYGSNPMHDPVLIYLVPSLPCLVP